MPSHLHEAFVDMFRQHPSLAPELLAGPLGVELPSWQQARLESAELTNVLPTEYRADAVVVLTDADRPTLAVVIEAQLGRDGAKRRSWPVYLTTLHARLGCPTLLLVICANAATASWCARPIRIGHPGFELAPLVYGPSPTSDPPAAEAAGTSPEFAVLAAIAHGEHPDRDKTFHGLLTVLGALDDERANRYTDIVLAALPEAARRHLEELMTTGTYEYPLSDFARRHYGQGKAEGEAHALLEVLAARGIDVPDNVRSRITGCTDLDQLRDWLRRAATADTIADVLGAQ